MNNFKNCRICKNRKLLNEFHVKKGTKDGHRNECKDCVKIIQIKYKEKPDFKEIQRLYDKNRYEEKKEYILKRKKEYYQENKHKLLDKKKSYQKTENFKIINKKWRFDNKKRLSQLQKNYRQKYPHIISWRSILHSTIKRFNTKKENKTINILGYSALELKNHIEIKFKHGMSWDNRNDWHIDHIKPVSKFESSSKISEVCSLNNLQPLWSSENLSKSNKYF